MKQHNSISAVISSTRKAADISNGVFTELKRNKHTADLSFLDPSLVNRALQVLKKFLTEGRKIGISPWLRGCRYWLQYEGRGFKFRLHEGPGSRYAAREKIVGPLTFQLSTPDPEAYFDFRLEGEKWSDDADGKLEKKIPLIVEAFPRLVAEQQAQREKEAQERMAEEARRNDAMRVASIAQARDLRSDIQRMNDDVLRRAFARWKARREFQEFFNEIEERFPRVSNPEVDAWLNAWRPAIEAMDPFLINPPWKCVYPVTEEGRKVIPTSGVLPM